MSRRVTISWHIRRMTEQPFDLFQKYPRQRRHRLRPVGQYAPQPLRHCNHPLPHGDRRNDMVSKVCRRMGHPSTCTGGTDPAALARKRHQKAMATDCAVRPCKPKAEQPAAQKPTELFFNMMPDRPAALVALGKPALQVPCDDLIERRSLRPPTGITLLWNRSPRDR